MLPSDGPSEPANESPPIQSRRGAAGVSGDRHRTLALAGVDVAVAGSLPGGSPARAASVGRSLEVSITPVRSSTAPVTSSSASRIAKPRAI
jgi:hypothetical protein